MAATDPHLGNIRMYVNDMVALEKDILEAVERQKEDDRVNSDPECTELLERIHSITRAHLLTMENHAAAVGGDPGTTIKEAITTVAGAVAGIYDKVRKHPVSRMLRDDYTALSLASAGYSMLHTTGLALRDVPIANVALRHLNEITPLIMELTRLLPAVVVNELAADDPNVDSGAVDAARKNVFEAWRIG